ncbi:MAG: hypothetical protein DRI37_04415 [Chloroflexi bacterium]|nr:MAG: hypothetical protein DRI37_04415 [Chloroflexota bacterium]
MKNPGAVRGRNASVLVVLLAVMVLLTACGRAFPPTTGVSVTPKAISAPSLSSPSTPTPVVIATTTIVPPNTPDVTPIPSPMATPVLREKLVVPISGTLNYTTVLTIESPVLFPTVVLEGNRLFITGGDESGSVGKIFMYDFDTEVMKSVVSSTYGPQGTMTDVDVSGEWLAWETHSGWGTDWILYAKNLTTGEEILIDSAEQAGATSPRGAYLAVSGNTLVWATIRKVDDGPLNSNVMAYDLKLHQTQVITSARMPDNVGYVDIDGERVVWSRGSTAGDVKRADVFMYDLATQECTQLSYDGLSGQPHIWGDYVIWRQGFEDIGPVVIYNWKTDAGIRLSESGGYLCLGDGLASFQRYLGDVSFFLYDIEYNLLDGFLPMWHEGQEIEYYGGPSIWGRKMALSYRDMRTRKWYIEVRQY